jgi:hypothetical protein
VCAAAVANLRELTERVDVPQIFPAVRIDDDRRLERGRFGIIPEKELFSITSECNFD